MSDVEIEETGEAVEESSQTTIDELFEPEVEEEAEAEPETEGEGAAEPTAEKEEEAEAESESEPPADEKASGLQAALVAERKKRQELEKQLSERTREPEKVPDPVEDPEGYATYLDQRRSADAYALKASISRELMMGFKDDYAEKEAVFVELAQNDPGLLAKINAADNPAKFAYDTAVEHLEVQKLRDPKYIDGLVEAKAKEIAEKMIADMKPGKKTALDVPNLAKAPAAGSNTVQVETVDDLDTMFADSAL